jgi:hypothetical protein
MENINVSKEKLLEILKKNRELHRDIFIEAQKNYRSEVISVLDKMLSDARAGKSVSHSINLMAPEDHTSDYDRVILMLELSLDDTIGLSERDAQQYVMDKWSWSHDWAVSNSRYSSLFGGMAAPSNLTKAHADKLSAAMNG